MPLPAGLGVPKRRLEGLSVCSLASGRLERQSKAPLPAGLGVPKKVFGGLGAFEAWQTAGLNANKKLLIKSY